MELLQLASWFVFLAIALFILVQGSSLFLKGARMIGATFGLSGFAIGVMIVAFGTSLPELASSIAAALNGTTEIVVANVVGSNITNILLIVGLMAVISGKIVVTNELIKTELPIFFIATAHFVVVLFDGVVDKLEALLLLGTFSAYVWYLVREGKIKSTEKKVLKSQSRFDIKIILYIIIGIAGVLVGAHYTVLMSVQIATALLVPIGLISIAAIAIGTSLPELFVSLHALKKGEVELAIGNIFGSNAFNILVVIGIPALIAPLVVEPIIMQIGLPILVAASAIFFVTGLSRQVMRWEGVMMLLFFVFFIIKLAAFV